MSPTLFKCCLIGYGYWGPNLARNIHQNKDLDLRRIIDLNVDLVRSAKSDYPAAICGQDINLEILEDNDVFFVATPASTHFEICRLILESRKNVAIWIEKPAFLDKNQQEMIKTLAKQSNSVVFVDHTYKYNAAILEVKRLISNGKLIDPLYYLGIRANLGAFQKDINVLWDLAIHDLSIIQFLFPDYKPISVSCNMGNPLNYGMHNISSLQVNYSNGFSANIFSSWLSPVKIRLTHFGFRNSTVVFDENEPSEKVKIYDQTFLPTDNRLSIDEQRVSYRLGDMHSPKIANNESLKSAIEDFVNGIKSPEISLRNQIGSNDELLAVLCAAEQSFIQGGSHKKVDLI